MVKGKYFEAMKVTIGVIYNYLPSQSDENGELRMTTSKTPWLPLKSTKVNLLPKHYVLEGTVE